ncbi:hypothetical protein QUF84_20300 [Fictibacillus enclensis]|uniref:hypothetical protein n=1 Tax=Fictibacillus enclensis TaxID=1017270 RepID=UPI0025A20028|nr:hypothetical protein [Fictibacillus enclensis]MDM5339545.1 hypothetical protein [Fictibacillus enclensis]
MKRFLVFIGLFLIGYILLQLVSGLFLTAGYSPEIMDQGKTVGYQVFGRISFFIGTLLIATLAFFLSEKIIRINK